MVSLVSRATLRRIGVRVGDPLHVQFEWMLEVDVADERVDLLAVDEDLDGIDGRNVGGSCSSKRRHR